MLETVADLVDAVRRVYSDAPLPRPFRLLEIIAGRDTQTEGSVRIQKRRLDALRQVPDPILEALGCDLMAAGADQALARARRIIGQLLLGQIAERAFEKRVYAVRVRSFARNYRNAELDMHFSIAQDLTPLSDFLSLIKNTGLHGVTGHLERGLV